jgi:type I restriction enzyme S subunit
MSTRTTAISSGGNGEASAALSSLAALPNKWTWVKLGDVCKTTSGGTPSRKNAAYFTGDIPWVKSGELSDGIIASVEERITEEAVANSSAKLFPTGTLLIALYGATAGKLGILKEDATTNQAVCAIFPPKNLDTKYLFWYLRFVRSGLVAQAIGGAQPNISQGILRALPIPVAPLDQQKSIVAEIEKQFSCLDEAIASLKRVKANLKRYKAAVLKAAVEGRLVETEAELARREGRSFETGEQLIQRILETRRSQWKGKGKYKEPAAPDTTDLPELPEGWVWATTEQLGFVQLGRQRSPKNRSKDYPVQYIRAANITENGIDLNNVLDMEFTPDEQERYRLWQGDVLLSEASGSPDQVGKPAIWQDQLPLCCFQNTVIRLRPAIQMSSFLLACFQAYYANGVFAKMAGGVGINHLSADKFSRVHVLLPPFTEQNRIVIEIDRRLSLLGELEAQVNVNFQRAKRLRQSILSKAFSKTLLAAI